MIFPVPDTQSVQVLVKSPLSGIYIVGVHDEISFCPLVQMFDLDVVYITFFEDFVCYTDWFFFTSASSLNGQKDSIYSLALNSMGTVLISGSTEKVIQ